MKLIVATLLFGAASFMCSAQEPVTVGDGSYASSIPPEPTEFWAGEVVNVKRWHETVPLRVVPGVKPPLPTNKWWSSLLFQDNVKQGHALWAHPLNVTVERYGVGFRFADRWSGPHGAFQETFFVENPNALQISGRGFAPVDQRVKAWGDWTVQFRVAMNDETFIDVTAGHGMPCLWVEYSGIERPRIGVQNAEFFGLDGKPLALPATGDCLGMVWEGRTYGLFTPDGTTFVAADGAVELAMPAGRRFVTVAALPAQDRLAAFRRHAFAVPRDTRVAWKYDAEAGTLTTEWTIDTEPLKGDERDVIQGWIPHHYRGTRQDFEFSGDEYPTARGTMRCAIGGSFRITYDYRGSLTHLPAPEQSGFDRGRMHGYLDAFAGWPHAFNPETYAGGKQVAMFARQLAMASVIHHPATPTIATKLRGELENVLTYTPGEANKFFGFTDRFGGLIGFQCGFGSHRFNDHHFHYGYYVYAAGLLALHDPDFAARYGEMAKLVAKTYANWDRADRRFPFLRTLDVWEGHSWACGGADNSPWFGENQESSSEAMMSWAAVIALGNALGNEAMTAAGIFGYVTEAAATNEYWFDRYDENFPAAYGPPGHISCITWGNQIQYITYFGPEPLFVHGIQYLPILPSSYYLVREPAAAATEFSFLLSNSESSKYGRFKTRDSWDAQWACEVMRYASLFDPAWASEWFERLWRENAPQAHDSWESGLTYFFIEANKDLGRRDWTSHIAAPDSGVFHDAARDRFTYCARNPTDTPQSYTVYRSGKAIGRLDVPACTFLSVHALDGNKAPTVTIVSPPNGLALRTGDVEVEARAADADGTIAKVEFFDGSTLLGAVVEPPYTIRATHLADGRHTLFAKASDDKGLAAYSPMVGIACDLPAADIVLEAPTPDFRARMTGKANPTITFVPGDPIRGCGYVDLLVKINGKDAGAFRMTKTDEGFRHGVTAAVGDRIECSFTYQTPPAGERNTHTSPCRATVGGGR